MVRLSNECLSHYKEAKGKYNSPLSTRDLCFEIKGPATGIAAGQVIDSAVITLRADRELHRAEILNYVR
jgi:hypothetical protein